jgi:hypothetical protein
MVHEPRDKATAWLFNAGATSNTSVIRQNIKTEDIFLMV